MILARRMSVKGCTFGAAPSSLKRKSTRELTTLSTTAARPREVRVFSRVRDKECGHEDHSQPAFEFCIGLLGFLAIIVHFPSPIRNVSRLLV